MKEIFNKIFELISHSFEKREELDIYFLRFLVDKTDFSKNISFRDFLYIVSSVENYSELEEQNLNKLAKIYVADSFLKKKGKSKEFICSNMLSTLTFNEIKIAVMDYIVEKFFASKGEK
jgi:hypothetical protein